MPKSDSENIAPSASQAFVRRSDRRKSSTTFFGKESSNMSAPEATGKGVEIDRNSDSSLSSEEPSEDDSDRDHAPSKKNKRAKTKKSQKKVTPLRKAGSKPRASRPSATGLPHDNEIFNSLRGDAELDVLAKSVVVSYRTKPSMGIADIVTCFLRACGCNGSVSSDEAEDLDGVVSVLEELQNTYKQESSHVYPLVAKTKDFKSFRPRLIKFLEHLMEQMADEGYLYDDTFCESLQSWIIAMSSSTLRGFRHTATVIALHIVTCLCDIDQQADTEIIQYNKQKESEEKKKRANTERIADLDQKLETLSKNRERIATYLTEIFDAVFVHRYRDADAIVRAECARDLGKWMLKSPSHFLEGPYLRYLGWTLSDKDRQVRLESVKSLIKIYATDDLTTHLKQFGDRFRNRLCEMACFDVDTAVRVQAITVVTHFHDHDMLQDAHEARILPLLFHAEERIRRAVAPFVADYIEEDAKAVSAKSRRKSDLNNVNWSVLKRCMTFLHEKGQQEIQPLDIDEEMEEIIAQSKLSSNDLRDRVEVAIAALYPVMDVLRDYSNLVSYASFDHTRRMDESQEGEGLAEALRLTDPEESLFLQTLVVVIKQQGQEAKAVVKKGNTEVVDNTLQETTRQLMTLLPKLFMRYSADPDRLCHILRLPSHMKLDEYIDLRRRNDYDMLLENISKQFLHHSKHALLLECVQCLRHADTYAVLQPINASRRMDIAKELIADILERIRNVDIQNATFAEDELYSLSLSVKRLASLLLAFDCTPELDADVEGVSVVDLHLKLLARGRLGEDSETDLVVSCIQTMEYHVMWKLQGVQSTNHATPLVLTTVRDQSANVVSRLSDIAFGSMSNAVEKVKLCAFASLVNLMQVLSVELPEGQSLDFSPAPSLQVQCSTFLQTLIDRRAAAAEDEKFDKDELEFEQLVADFVRLVRTNVFAVQRAAVVLANHGRLGKVFDGICKHLVTFCKEQFKSTRIAEAVSSLSIDAMQQSFDMYLENDETFASFNGLVKLLASIYQQKVSNATAKQYLSSQVAKISTALVDFVMTKISGYQRIDNDEAQSKALDIFKALLLLVGEMQVSDARNILKHLAAIGPAKGVDMSSVKQDDSYEAYVDKLKTITGNAEPMEVDSDPIEISTPNSSKRSRAASHSSDAVVAAQVAPDDGAESDDSFQSLSEVRPSAKKVKL